MGKGGGQTVGYGYAIDLVYGFCEKADVCSGFRMDGDVKWEGWLTTSGEGFNAPTGRRGDTLKSDFKGQSAVQVWLGGDSTPEQLMHDLVYKNVVLAHFRNYCKNNPTKNDPNLFWCWDEENEEYVPCGELEEGEEDPDAVKDPCHQAPYPDTNTIPIESFRLVEPDAAFIGDNTTAVPSYELRFHRYDINEDLFGDKQQVIRGINPAVAIYDILVNQLHIDPARINEASFVTAATILSDEKLGLSFILTRSKKATDWIKEILRYADGIVYFNPVDEQYAIRLFRKDYDEDNLLVIDESNVSNLVIERSAWTDVISTFRFKYAIDWEKTSNTYEIINSAAIEVNGYETSKEFDFQMLSDPACLPYLMTRVVQKHGLPGVKVKFRINFVLGSALTPGDVIKLKSDKLEVSELLLRIIKIGGDKEENPYLDIECINDLYANPIDILEIPEATYRTDVDVTLDGEVEHAYALSLDYFFCKTDDLSDNSWIIVAAPNEANEYVESVRETTAFQESPSYAQPFQYGKIIQASKDGMNYLSEIGYNRDFQIIMDNPYTTTGTGSEEVKHYRFVHNIELEEWEFQQGQLMIVSEKENKIFFIRKLEVFNNYEQVRLTGIADPLTELHPDDWYNGDTSTLYNIDWGNSDKIYVRYGDPIHDSETVSFPSLSERCLDASKPVNRIGYSLVNSYSSTDTAYADALICTYFWKPKPPFDLNYEIIEGHDTIPDIFEDSSDLVTLPFNDTMDELSQGLSIIVNGDEEYKGGQFDDAYKTDGNDYLIINNFKAISSGEMTVSLWVQLDNVSGDQTIISFSKDDEKTLELLRRDDTLILVQDGVERGDPIENIPVHDGVYTNVILDDSGKVWINNSLELDTGYTVDVTSFNKDALIGCGRNTSGGVENYFNGGIDHLRIFDKHLDDEERKIVYQETPFVDDFYEVKWRPVYYKKGASMQNADEWNGYNEEGLIWGDYAIETANSDGTRKDLYTNINDDFADSDGWVRLRIPKSVVTNEPNWRIFCWNPDFGGSLHDDTYIDYGYEENTVHFTLT